MIRVIAIDDEPLALKQLCAYVEKVPYMELVDACSSAIDAQQILQNEHVDAIFLDINMPGMTGLELVRTMSAPPMVVFTTAYSEHAVEGFEVNALDYLLKPFSFDEFLRAANRIKSQYELVNNSYLASVKIAQQENIENSSKTDSEFDNDTIFVKSDYKVVRIRISEILYIEAMSEYLRLHLLNSDRPVVVLLSMKKIEERLPASFMRIHRSYIINLNRIAEISKARITMENGEELPVGDNYKDNLNSYTSRNYIGR